MRPRISPPHTFKRSRTAGERLPDQRPDALHCKQRTTHVRALLEDSNRLIEQLQRFFRRKTDFVPIRHRAGHGLPKLRASALSASYSSAISRRPSAAMWRLHQTGRLLHLHWCLTTTSKLCSKVLPLTNSRETAHQSLKGDVLTRMCWSTRPSASALVQSTATSAIQRTPTPTQPHPHPIKRRARSTQPDNMKQKQGTMNPNSSDERRETFVSTTAPQIDASLVTRWTYTLATDLGVARTTFHGGTPALTGLAHTDQHWAPVMKT